MSLPQSSSHWFQGILNAFGISMLFLAFQMEIPPSNVLIYLTVIHMVLFATQWFKKIPAGLIFIVIICWTLICLKYWPTDSLLKDLGWKDYTAALASVAFALSGWLMHSYNTKRW